MKCLTKKIILLFLSFSCTFSLFGGETNPLISDWEQQSDVFLYQSVTKSGLVDSEFLQFPVNSTNIDDFSTFKDEYMSFCANSSGIKLFGSGVLGYATEFCSFFRFMVFDMNLAGKDKLDTVVSFFEESPLHKALVSVLLQVPLTFSSNNDSGSQRKSALAARSSFYTLYFVLVFCAINLVMRVVIDFYRLFFYIYSKVHKKKFFNLPPSCFTSVFCFIDSFFFVVTPAVRKNYLNAPFNAIFNITSLPVLQCLSREARRWLPRIYTLLQFKKILSGVPHEIR